MRLFFDKIIGNTEAKQRLGHAILEDRLHHALLICGPYGSGKRTLATEIAAALNCENKYSASHTLPCGICNTCRRIRENKFLDVKYFSKDPSHASISIDEVRRMKSDTVLNASESDYRIYVFENTELMTVGAQNSLLKILEEPPERVVILLLCESPDRLLTTVNSRVQRIGMQVFSQEELAEKLTAISSEASSMMKRDPDGFHSILASSGGAIGKALELLDPETVARIKQSNESTRQFIKAFMPKTPYYQIKSRISCLPTGRVDLIIELERAQMALADIITSKYDRDKATMIYRDMIEAREELSLLGIKRALNAYELINDTLAQCRANVNIQTLISSLAGKIATIK